MGQPFALSKHSCNLLFVLFIQAKTPNREVENGVFHYPVGPFVFRVTAAFAIYPRDHWLRGRSVVVKGLPHSNQHGYYK